ncbi:terminase [Mycobacterium phage Panamaxus]|uniref:Terminase n=1 Tax=Mycobacterium phage Veracruz TaxID=2530154 RepID=A0A481VSP6_9CAUD|nr:terminase large subunit [Mycobacterium phage Veracruz]AIS73685.1 terminase [Mycobacterium phage QuinnKiro]ALA11814.1 terminase [Mycobacterium phage Texage]AOT24161.1 terminase [Mycobacterium phage Todacoro]AUX82308.1 terminase large subunit [Mycobacterium phage Lambert1]AVP42937.1 terminase [Mycobacterium phage Panamaxus]AWY03543.1 terminase large subunit [Mycobacterium phage Hookmount]AYR03391.1 terminase large subunit [Mycobacterium phage Popcicle]AZV00578.1 terminase [Mycobacterium ph
MSLNNHHPVPLLPQPPHKIGPVWQVREDGSWHLPEKTLGWEILNWLAKYVRSPAGGGPFLPTLEQARFILWWYAVDDQGRYVYREGCLRRMKGWGKDPLCAAIALAELCGPVAFSHFDADGNPVGKARHAAWITIAAVSQDQTKNTFSMFPVMISKELKAEYGLDVNKFVIYTEVGGRIEAATSSPASMEGNRPTLVIENETQWWGVGPDGNVNDGVDMDDVIEGNVAKIPSARKLAICNAHIPGNDTVAERAYDHWQDVQSGKAVDTGILYDALEAPADTPVSEIPSQKEDPEGYEKGIEALMDGLMIARGDSYWLPLEEILGSVLNTRNPVSESRRKFLNQVNAHEDSWVAPNEWDRLAVTDKQFALQPNDRITLGFDGSKSNDWTALVACRIEDGMLFVLRVWNPEDFPGDEVPREDVDATVRSAFQRYDVVAFRADVKEFEAYVDQWSRDFKRKIKVNATPGNPIAFDMRGQTKRFALDCERFLDAVIERELSHDGNPVLRQHVLNARRHPTTFDAISIRKESKDSSKKIDAAVCAVLAFGARQDYLMSKRSRSGRAVVIR